MPNLYYNPKMKKTSCNCCYVVALPFCKKHGNKKSHSAQSDNKPIAVSIDSKEDITSVTLGNEYIPDADRSNYKKLNRLFFFPCKIRVGLIWMNLIIIY